MSYLNEFIKKEEWIVQSSISTAYEFAKEIRALNSKYNNLNIKDINPINSGTISINCSISDLFTFIEYSKLCSHAFLKLKEIPAQSDSILYSKVRKLHWEKIIPLDHTFSIKARGQFEGTGMNALFFTQRLKDAIVDEIKKHKNLERPDVDRENPDIIIHAFVNSKRRATLLLRINKQPLYRRFPEKNEVHSSPLKENLAHLVALCSQRNHPEAEIIYDPFCGTGNLLFEYRCKDSPIILNEFDLTSHFQDLLISKKLKKDSYPAQREQNYFGCDIEADYIKLAKKQSEHVASNIIRGKSFIDFKNAEASDAFLELDPSKSTAIISNPPYGFRLGKEKKSFYDYMRLLSSDQNKFKDLSLCLILPLDMIEELKNIEGFSQNFKKIYQSPMIQNGALDCHIIFWKKIERNPNSAPLNSDTIE